jgi:hypothetical protein
MLEQFDVACFGGPHDGLSIRMTATPSFVFEERGKNGVAVRRSVYALEVTEQGTFRLRFLNTQEDGQ